MTRKRNTLGPLIGYHGCERRVAERVLAGKEGLKKSENDYDWLGPGIYFWVDSVERAWDWADQQKARKGWEEAAVVGAFIHPGLCLNLTDYGVNDTLVSTHAMMTEIFGDDLQENESKVNGIFMRRNLDCAVINSVHTIRAVMDEEPFDTVYGVFEEGGELFTGSGFRKKTHVQLAVCNPESILGYFRAAKVPK